MIIDKYLEQIQADEQTSAASGITGFEVPHKRKVLRTYYPRLLTEPKKEEDEEDESLPHKAIGYQPSPVPIHLEINSSKNKRLMIDFDRTIHKYSKGYYDGTIYDEPIPGAKEALDILHNRGYEIIIFTARGSSESEDRVSQLKAVEKWLNNYGIYYDRITSEKLPAFAYIDDLGIRFKGNWRDTLRDIIGTEITIKTKRYISADDYAFY